jgi:peptidoglycan/xylan/chitin deacetylase (PgdA/CDA1 family)
MTPWRVALGAVIVAAVAIVAWPTRHHPTPQPRAAHRVVIERKVVAPRVYSRSRTSVPILMYHVIATPPAGADYPGLYVTPSELAGQVDALARAGFHAVTLDRMRAGWLGRAELPAHPIVISFDNGYRTQYTEALPILRRHGWVADENIQLSGLPPSQGGLTRRQVRELVAAGWELDTQGWSHADLPTLDTASLRFQIGAARRRLRRAYGVRADWFCYPSGRYDPAVLTEVHAAGFVGATTVVPGWASPDSSPYELPRLRVLGGTSPAQLLTQIRAARTDAPPPSSY